MAQMRKSVLFSMLVAASLLGGLVALLAQRLASPAEPTFTSFDERQKSWLSGLTGSKNSPKAPIDFTSAAKQVRQGVVHIKTTYGQGGSLFNRLRQEYEGGSLEDFFNRQNDELPGYTHPEGVPLEATGSGVLISDDGYIVTNNHVVAKAKEITVLLNDKRSYKAKIVGTDPSTDLALLKIEGRNLPFIPFGNSDSLEIGEWVLAVGNPFELTSTVTAGIVSAKSRNINILSGKDNLAVESFIQTDAAVNPGNSGGALVNLHGELVGINTAIASTTGTYAGYSFAIPVTLAKKVMDDLRLYGTVQRALLGVSIRDVDAALAEEAGIPNTRGVYVAGVVAKGGAGQSGIKKGDVILQVNDVEVNSVSALQEYVARFRPGDKLRVRYERGSKIADTQIVLRTATGSDKIAASEPRPKLESSYLKATLQTCSQANKAVLGITNGVEVVEIEEGSVLETAGIQAPFIIINIDKKPVSSPAEVERIIRTTRGGILVEGLYPDGRRMYYAVGM